MAAQEPESAHRFFLEAFNAGDADALAALYEPQAVLSNRHGQTVQGADAIREAYRRFVAANPQMKLRTRYALRAGELALLCSEWEMPPAEPGGQVRKHRSVEVVRRQADGSWRYVIDHPYGAD
jgi:uncharacterized protein (TIGR02246 family)